MYCISKRYILKIPLHIEMYYCTNSNTVIFKNFSICKTIKLKTQVIVNKDQKLVKITRNPLQGISNNEKKKLKSIQATQTVILKQMISDISFFACKKLKLVGVGFRVSSLKVSADVELLSFKLGYSHIIYFKIPKTLNIFCTKPNRLIIIGNSSLFLSQIAAILRAYKSPEPYKGKGVLYTSEKITLKEGKKI